MRANIYERQPNTYNSYRITKSVVCKLVDEVGISDTVDNYLHSICEPDTVETCVHKTASAIMKFYNSTYLDGLTNALTIFNFLRYNIILGEKEAQFLLQAKCIGFQIKENEILFNTELTESEYERFELDGSVGDGE